MSGRLRVLSIATLFPNPRMPVHAQFVKQRLDALSKRVDLTVASPVPWFPFERLIPRYANRNLVPPSTDGNAYPTYFPKFLSVPMLFKPLDAVFLFVSMVLFIRRHHLADRIDLFDCHLAFPEGFAGAWLRLWFRKPYVVTLRGHDINDLHRYPVRIRQVVYALRHASRYFGVAQALVDGAVKLGAPAATGFRSANGVDPARFFPLPKAEARTLLGLDPNLRYMLSVSHLVRRKGVDILIRSLAILAKDRPDLRFIIAGKGGEEGDVEGELRALEAELGLGGRIVWAGAVLNTELYRYYSAADVFCLASEKEGWPNVLLEALACGTPAVATATWGVPEVLPTEDVGLLVGERTPEAFARRISDGLDKAWDYGALLAYAGRRSWDSVAEELEAHLLAAAGRKGGEPAP